MKDIFLNMILNVLKNFWFHNDLLFLTEGMIIEKVKKLIANLHRKTEYIMRIKNLTQPLNHGLVFKNFYRVIKLNQNAWLKQYIYINTDLRKTLKKLKTLTLKKIFLLYFLIYFFMVY